GLVCPTWAGIGFGRAAGTCGRAAGACGRAAGACGRAAGACGRAAGAAIEGVRLNEALPPACGPPPPLAAPARPPARCAQTGTLIKTARQKAEPSLIVFFITGDSPAGLASGWCGPVEAAAASARE